MNILRGNIKVESNTFVMMWVGMISLVEKCLANSIYLFTGELNQHLFAPAWLEMHDQKQPLISIEQDYGCYNKNRNTTAPRNQISVCHIRSHIDE
jgi:hypothetical protein